MKKLWQNYTTQNMTRHSEQNNTAMEIQNRNRMTRNYKSNATYYYEYERINKTTLY